MAQRILYAPLGVRLAGGADLAFITGAAPLRGQES
jgi:hypothetical protein